MSPKIHLLFSALVLVPIGMAYGLLSPWVDVYLFDHEIASVDQKQILKAIMGLYFAMAGFWAYAAFNSEYQRVATLTNVVFMGGLAFGRLLSFGIDGLPSFCLVFGFLGEVFLAAWGIYNLRKVKGGG
jgi:Domain of unknown function (DUF4345)